MAFQRAISLLVAAGYIVAAGLIRGWQSNGMIALLAAALLPIPFIWFGEALGAYVGPADMGAINRPTPGIAIVVTAWVILLTVPPLVIWLGMFN